MSDLLIREREIIIVDEQGQFKSAIGMITKKRGGTHGPIRASRERKVGEHSSHS